MADLAIGRNCPSDGTLTACAGSYGDAQLVGVCAVCKQSIYAANPYYVAPPVVAAPEDVTPVTPPVPDSFDTLPTEPPVADPAPVAEEPASA